MVHIATSDDQMARVDDQQFVVHAAVDRQGLPQFHGVKLSNFNAMLDEVVLDARRDVVEHVIDQQANPDSTPGSVAQQRQKREGHVIVTNLKVSRVDLRFGLLNQIDSRLKSFPVVT
jgi:hypothetical protein